MPKISIIMPVYGVEQFISKAIESVINQTFKDWELIVVNDGTKDKSAEIAKKYALINEKIKVIDKKNGGLSDARNFGLKYATGKYIHFFDSDDWIDKTFYDNLINCIDNPNIDIIISGYTIDNIKKNGDVSLHKKNIVIPQNNESILIHYISSFFNFAWNKLFKLEFIKAHSLEFKKGLKYIEDCEFMARVIKYDPIIIFSSTTDYHYRNDNRYTLSKEFSSSTIEINADRVALTESILNIINQDFITNNKVIELLKFNIIRHLLHLLFSTNNHTVRKNRIRQIKNILNTPKLTLNSPNKQFSKIDLLLWIICKYKLSFLIFLIYNIKNNNL